jgi:ankyrin repeat protein
MQKIHRILVALLFGCNAVHAMDGEQPAPIQNLFEAIKNENIPVVQSMIKQDPELISTYGTEMGIFGLAGVPPLHIAAARGCDKSMKVLLDHKADPNIQVDHMACNSPLHCVTTAIGARLLIKKGGLVDKCNKNGETPLHIVLFDVNPRLQCKEKRLSVAQVLVHWGASINKKCHGMTYLHRAIQNKQEHILDFLLGNRADIHMQKDWINTTPIEEIADNWNEPDVLKILQKHGIFLFPKIKPQMLFSLPEVRNNNIQLNENNVAFLNRWAAVFSYAYSKKNKQISSSRNGVICNAQGCIMENVSPHDLRQFFTEEILEIINHSAGAICAYAIEQIKSGDALGLEKTIKQFPFILSYSNFQQEMVYGVIAKKNAACLQVLLQNQLDPAIISENFDFDGGQFGGNALHLAAFFGDTAAVPLLMKHGASYLQKDANDRTPMAYALELKRENIVAVLNKAIVEEFLSVFSLHNYEKSKQLLKQITDCNILDELGDGLLHRMIDSFCGSGLFRNPKAKKLVNLLVQKGANPNMHNAKGDTPLWHLIGISDKQIWLFELLLNAGANVNIGLVRNSHSLLGVALFRKNYPLAQLFLKHGAIVSLALLNKYKTKTKIPQELRQALRDRYDERNDKKNDVQILGK